jgi:Chromo (CHRromatin Organisation MOdifier) domain
MSDGNVYEVSHIVDEDYSNPNKRIFRVRWLGYTSKYDSWEPLENLQDGALEVVRNWDLKKKQTQKRKVMKEKSNTLQKKGKSTSQINDNSRRGNFRRGKRLGRWCYEYCMKFNSRLSRLLP